MYIYRWAYDFQQLLPEIQKMNGTIIGSCAQTPHKIGEGGAWSNEKTGDVVTIQYYHDNDASFGKKLNVIIEDDPEKSTKFAGTPGKKSEYPYGMTQPGCIVIDKSGNRLFEWFHPASFHPKGGERGDPNPLRGNGAVGRVEPDDVLQIVKDKLNGNNVSIAEPRINAQKEVMKKTVARLKAMRDAKKTKNASSNL